MRNRGRSAASPARAALFALAALGLAAPVADAHIPDKQKEGPTGIEVRAIEPPLTPTPQGECGPGSRPETGLQGRVSRADHESGRAALGYTCNTELVGSYEQPNVIGTVGGFKVERYVDAAGRECAYYDASLLFPTSILDFQGGVNVLDMSNPASPQLTARLITPGMLSPHESLVVSQARGLLVAVTGNPLTAPGIVDVYDISADCRNPILRSSSPVGILGHESGLSPDGKTFYSASTGGETLVAVDITNPSLPLPLTIANVPSHGLSISPDGNRAYVAAVSGGGGGDPGLVILDTSQVQARQPLPTMPVVSRLTWEGVSIPQNAIPVTIGGKQFVIEIDDSARSTRSAPGASSTSATSRTRRSSRTCGSTSTSPRTSRRSRTTPRRAFRSRVTRATTATSRRG